MSYFRNKMRAVEFVDDLLGNSELGSPLTMIIGRDKSGDYYAHTVTVVLSDDTDSGSITICSDEPTSTSQQNTPDG